MIGREWTGAAEDSLVLRTVGLCHLRWVLTPSSRTTAQELPLRSEASRSFIEGGSATRTFVSSAA